MTKTPFPAGQKFAQRIKPFVPEAAVCVDPFKRIVKALGLETAAPQPPILVPLDQPGLLEHAEMLGDGGQRHLRGVR
jgi:hypothetical protein